MLESFGKDISVAIVGASGGIGRAFVETLASQPQVARVAAFTRREVGFGDAKVTRFALDLEDEDSIERAAAEAANLSVSYHLIILASGLLHDGEALQPEKTWRSLERASLERAFRVNSIGPALAAKHFLPLLSQDRKAAFAALSARVGSIADNGYGGWYAYRASKAALNMLIKTLSIELARKSPEALCVALHPGTVDTGLSKPFQRGVPEDKLFSPDFAAGKLLGVLDGLGPEDSGGLFAWDGARIPY